MKAYLFGWLVYFGLMIRFIKFVTWIPDTTKGDIRARVFLGLTEEDGTPTMCPECLGNEFYDKVIDTIQGQACEYETICKSCDYTCGYWSYGNYMP